MYNPDGRTDRGGAIYPEAGGRLNRDGFATLFRSHHQTLWMIAASVLGDRTHAHDVLQEAAMIAMGKLDDFDPATSFAAWMGQIVRYTALNEGRKLARTKARGQDEDDSRTHERPDMSTSPGPHDAAFDAKVAAALKTLDDKARSCLVLRTVQGLSYTSIASALGLPEGTVMSHVHRAKAALRTSLAGAAGGEGTR
ncbi:MAG: RNA polymerase sigma factor [Planctomycetes bacterium]|nr:RNA polymerase sigma factor [Planctomycetota bacterium]